MENVDDLDNDDLFAEFVLSGRQVHDKKKEERRCRCFEGVSKTFLLYLVYVWRTAVAMTLAAVFANLSSITPIVPSSLVFLVILAATLTVRPLLGMAISGLYALPLYMIVQLLATSVAVIMPREQPAVVALLIFLGVFIFHLADLGPALPKICSAIWLIALATRHLNPLGDPLGSN